MKSTMLGWFLCLIRVVMGAFFLMEALHHLTSDYIGGDGLEMKLRKGIDTAIPPYDQLIEHVFLKIDDPLTFLVIAGELAVGSALVLGLLTRFTAITAIFMNANFFLMNGPHLDSGGVDIIFMIGEALLFAFASGQALSADAALQRHGIESPLMTGHAPVS